MIEKVFYNVFIFGTIISICISPLLIFLYKNKYRYKLKSIYKVFMIILLLLILPINTINFSNIKNILPKQEVLEIRENFVEPIQTEIILETVNTVVEVNESINIKNNKLFSFAQLVPYLWISISSIFLFYNLITYFICLYEGKKKYIEIKVPEIEEKINKICESMNIKKISYSFFLENITTPMVVGIFKKRIILPVNILEVENYEMILMHEIVHIKNRDIECKFLLLLINTIYWFNPIIYKFIDQVEEVLELKCDEIVLENQPQLYKIKYAQVLLNQIEENRNSKYRFSLNFANKRRNIMKRFSNIVDKSKKKNMIGISCITASIIIISSAIVFSLPNINFASIQEDIIENVIDNNFVLEETVDEEENEVNENTLNNDSISKNATVENNSVNENVVLTETDENSNNKNSNRTKIAVVNIKTNLKTGEVIGENSSDEEAFEVVTEEKIEEEKVSETNEETKLEAITQSNDEEKESEDEVVTKKVTAIPELIYPIENNYEIVAGFYGNTNRLS